MNSRNGVKSERDNRIVFVDCVDVDNVMVYNAVRQKRGVLWDVVINVNGM